MDSTLYYQSRGFWRTHYSLLIIIVCFLSLGCNSNKSGVRILFVGDILLSRNVRTEYTKRNTFTWDSLQSQFKAYDLVVGNLEGAVGNLDETVKSTNPSPVFDIDSQHVPLLKKAGFNVITVENNHSNDLGPAGKTNAINALRKCTIAPIFKDNSPQFFTVKNVVISILALNTVLGRDSLKNQVPSIEVQQKLRLARSLSKVVIVSIHWGSELLEWPSKEQRELAKWLIENGADIIIGSHPHIIQKPELINGKPVFFSLGNHLFDQKYERSKEGLMVDILIENDKLTCNGFITHTQRSSYYPAITKSIDFGFKSFLLSNEALKVNNYIIKPLSVCDAKNNNKLVLEAFYQNKSIWKTHPMSIVTATTAKLDGANEYLFTLEKHFSSLDKEVNLRPYVYSVHDKGISAKWRGSALAWPFLDAQISPHNNKILCVLHRGDAFVNLDKKNITKRVATYQWNGFGFSGVADSLAYKDCKELFKAYLYK